MSLKNQASTSKHFTPHISLPVHPLRIPQKPSPTSSPSPSKKRRVDSIASSSLSLNSPALTDEDAFTRKRYDASMDVLSFWDSLEAKYSRDLADDDIVDLYTHRIVQDKGVIRAQPEHDIGSFDYAVSANKSNTDGTATPTFVDISDNEDEAQEEEIDEDDFEGWSNIPDQFGRSRPASLASSPRKPLFGNLPPIPTTTEEEDLAAFMEAEQARRDREGDFDAIVDAKLRAITRAMRREQRRVSSMSDSEASLGAIPSDREDSDDELNLGYTPSPSKRNASTRPSFRQLDQQSDAGGIDLGVPYSSQDEDIDPLNLFGVEPESVDDGEDSQSSNDEMLIGPPVSSPRKKVNQPPSEPVKEPDPPVNESEHEIEGTQDDTTDSDVDPIDAFSPPPRSLPPQHKYIPPLLPLRYAPQPKTLPPVPKLHPPPTQQQLWTPPLSTSSVEPYERNPGVKSWLASAARNAVVPDKLDSAFRSHLASPPLSSASATSSSAAHSSYFPPHTSSSFDTRRTQDLKFKTPGPPTPSAEPSDMSHPSSLRKGTSSPEKKQRVLQFDTTPRYDSDDLPSSPSRLRAVARSRSPTPPSVIVQIDPPVTRRQPMSLGKRKRDMTPESQQSTHKDHRADDTETDVEYQYESGPDSSQSVDYVSGSDPSDQEGSVDGSPDSQTSRQSRHRDTPPRALPSKHSPQSTHTSTAPAIPAPIPYHPPPQPLASAYPTYGYPQQLGQCPDPTVLSHVIQSLNYLAFNGLNASAPAHIPPVAQPLLAQHCSPTPHTLVHVTHPMPHRSCYQYPPHPYSLPPSPSPHMSWPHTFPTSTEPAQATSAEQPQTPRSSRHGSKSTKPKTKTPESVPETEGRSRRKLDTRRHSSSSPRKSGRATEKSTSSARSASRASGTAGPSKEPSLPRSLSSHTGSIPANSSHTLPPFATPKRDRVRAAAPRPNPFATPHRSSSAQDMDSLHTPRNPNPSPLRRSITASDLYDNCDGDTGRSRTRAPKARDAEFHTPSSTPSRTYSKHSRGRSTSRAPPATGTKDAVRTPTDWKFRVS